MRFQQALDRAPDSAKSAPLAFICHGAELPELQEAGAGRDRREVWIRQSRVGPRWNVISLGLAALAAFLLWMFHGIVFSGVQFGISIMRMGEDDGDQGGTRDTAAGHDAVPVSMHDRERG